MRLRRTATMVTCSSEGSVVDASGLGSDTRCEIAWLSFVASTCRDQSYDSLLWG